MRFGLCCKFYKEPIKFCTATAKHLSKFSRSEQLVRLSDICVHNGEALKQSVLFCAANGIGSFRVNSQILPLKTHPEVGYDLGDLPKSEYLCKILSEVKSAASQNSVRLTFHPDQFVILNSPRRDVVESSICELAYQAEVAAMIGADVINIHGGGGYGDKSSALKRLADEILQLPEDIRSLLTLENDDRTYTPQDFLPVCRETGVPLVYDVHHHRCNPDDLSVEEATQAALDTWDREPLFHISSPKETWQGKNPRPHADYIDIADYPMSWQDLDITVEIEAKAKECAISQLQKQLREVG